MSREIHPLTHIKKKKKEKIILISLIIITIFNVSFIAYLFKENKSNSFISEKKEENPTKPEKKSETKPKVSEKQKISKNQKREIITTEKKINFPQLDFSIEKDYLREVLEAYKLQNISLKKEKKVKKDFSYYYKLAKKAEKIRDLKSALAFYHKAYKFNPDEDILYKIAYLNYKLKAYRGAIKYLKRLIKQNPNYVDAYILLAKSYEKKRNLKKAVLILEETYYNFPENEKLMRELANFYEKIKNPYAAAEIYENLAKKENFKDILKAAKFYERLGNKEKALFYYKKALEKDNGTYRLWLKDKISKLSH